MIRFIRNLAIGAVVCISMVSTIHLLAAEQTWQTTKSADIELARKYSYMMSHNQVDKAMQYVADDVAFADYTWGEQSAVTGKKKLYEAYTAGGNGLHNITIDERLMFSGRGTVVFHYIFSADADVNEDSKPQDRMHGMADMVQVLTIKNGKIVRHLDFFNYDLVMPAFEAKAKELAKK